jgi:hypothetical protein
MAITDVTRRRIFDWVRLERVSWCGKLNEVEFLSRLYDLKALPSTDPRFDDFAGDIWQHRINNYDWDDDWVLSDSRIALFQASDETFARFLCEMLHPVVRDDAEAVRIAQELNEYLTKDGWKLAEDQRISGSIVYGPQKLGVGTDHVVGAARHVATQINTQYVERQLQRMNTAVATDPELAIGTAKEFLETVCRTILTDLGVPFAPADDLPKLVRATLKELRLTPDDIPDAAKAAETIRVLLMNLATVSTGIAQLRNPFGTGHGKVATAKGLSARHARLAVGAASTVAVFVFETWQEAAGAPKQKVTRGT